MPVAGGFALWATRCWWRGVLMVGIVLIKDHCTRFRECHDATRVGGNSPQLERPRPSLSSTSRHKHILSALTLGR